MTKTSKTNLHERADAAWLGIRIQRESARLSAILEHANTSFVDVCYMATHGKSVEYGTKALEFKLKPKLLARAQHAAKWLADIYGLEVKHYVGVQQQPLLESLDLLGDVLDIAEIKNEVGFDGRYKPLRKLLRQCSALTHCTEALEFYENSVPQKPNPANATKTELEHYEAHKLERIKAQIALVKSFAKLLNGYRILVDHRITII